MRLRPPRTRLGGAAAIVLGLAAAPSLASAQASSTYGPGYGPPPVVGHDTVTVVPGAEYEASGLHRFVFGGAYRELWTTPIRVPVLDLDRFAGGLTVHERGGGEQTLSLEFRNPDGEEWVFRSVNKDPSKALPEELRDTYAATVLQDQISAAFPAAALLVPPLAEALGVLVPRPQLAVMPDDPRLGEHRADFAGILGMIEEHPDEGPDDAPGFAGAAKIDGTDDLVGELNESPEDRIDARAYLTARLLDVVLNDWDRHQDQWEWARRDEDGRYRWVPIARDRDQALFSLEGLLAGPTRLVMPRFVRLDRRPNLGGLTVQSAALDGRVLAGLERAAWDSIARSVPARLTDSVIAAAVDRLPDAFVAKAGLGLREILRRRRDAIPATAAAWYAELARVVDVHGTDVPETAVVEAHEDGAVTVSLHETDERGEADDDAYFTRRFVPAETREVRIHLHGGADAARSLGRGPTRIRVRVIGGGGAERFSDSARVGLAFYDAEDGPAPNYGPDTLVEAALDRRPWRVAGDTILPPHPDRGGAMAPGLRVAYLEDLGLVASAGVARTSYGFRRGPYASRVSLDVGFASAPEDFDAVLRAEVRQGGGPLRWELLAESRGFERTRFHGLGNGTSRSDVDAFHEVDHSVLRARLGVGLDLGRHGSLSIGPQLELHRSDTAAAILRLARPYGAGDFGQLGAGAELALDTRDVAAAPRRGVLLHAGASVFPSAWDVEESFARVEGSAATYLALPAPLEPVVALRAGGAKLFGEFPWHSAAFLGGHETLRGWTRDRFAGEASAWGNAELRLRLFRANLLLPVGVGVFGLADAGRVWVDGGGSDEWHAALGGGLSLDLIDRASTFTVTIADSKERTMVYVRGGYAF
jgi:hypothetical protein